MAIADPTGDLDLSSMRPVTKTCHDVQLELSERFDTPVTESHPAPGLDAVMLDGCMSAQECEGLVARTEEMGYSFWNPNGERRKFRSADTVEVKDQRFAEQMWARIGRFCTPRINIEPDTDEWTRDTEGTWEAVGVSHDLLFGRYFSGGHFSPHTDGNTIVDLNLRSFYTCLFYLNDCPEGGATLLLKHEEGQSFDTDSEGRFRAPAGSVAGVCEVVTGRALVFNQNLVHEGQPVAEGNAKYIIRTDIMYRRTPPVCTAPEDIEAYRLMRLAEDAESQGRSDEAMKLFRRAFKMSQPLADIYGM